MNLNDALDQIEHLQICLDDVKQELKDIVKNYGEKEDVLIDQISSLRSYIKEQDTNLESLIEENNALTSSLESLKEEKNEDDNRHSADVDKLNDMTQLLLSKIKSKETPLSFSP